MRFIKNGVLLAGLIAGLAACGGDDDDDIIPVVDKATNYTAFVKGLLDDDPNGEPASINNRNFRFTNQENPDAYDDVLSSSN
ncbi:MAG TPA: hypothetical protein VFX91_10745 [Alcanivorax sp.]|nr:hypothetical protein [Alcanivorax sp.]